MPKIKARAGTENDLEGRIRGALEQRDREGTTLRELAILCKVPRSTLSDRARGGKTRQQTHEDYQTLTPGMEKALEKWVDTWDERGFPLRLDLFKAVATQLAEWRAEEEGDPSLAELGPSWLRGSLNRHPTYPTKFSVTLDRQRALSSNPTLIKNYFQKLGKALKKHAFKPENMCNMDEKGFLLGYNNWAKVIVRHRRRTPTETQGGSSEWITVVEPVYAITNGHKEKVYTAAGPVLSMMRIPSSHIAIRIHHG